jgi:hypothetical protein
MSLSGSLTFFLPVTTPGCTVEIPVALEINLLVDGNVGSTWPTELLCRKEVIRDSARKEFEASAAEKDPQIVTILPSSNLSTNNSA